MTDTWMDRLSEYVDGDLTPAERGALESHLAGCEACTRLLGELRQVVRSAALLPELQPPRDLWAGIAARIEGGSHAAATSHAAAASAATAATLPPAATPRTSAAARAGSVATRGAQRRRSYSFTAPQLAAAAVALMLLSGTAVWRLGGAGGPSIGGGGLAEAGAPAAQPPAPGGSAPSGEAAGRSPLLDGATRFELPPGGNMLLTGSGAAAGPGAEATRAAVLAELAAALGDARAYLDPQAVAALEQSLITVENALADARAALAADPGSPFLARHLENTTARKAELLRTAGRFTARS